MADAFIKLYNKMLKWEWYDDINTKVVFLHCLLKANWEVTKWHGVEIGPGQFITSLGTLAKETHLTVKQVRTALEHLKTTGEVASKGQSKFRIITVNNWSSYQGCDKQKGKQGASKGQAEGKQRATVKDIYNLKSEYIREEEKELKTNTPYNPPQYFPNDENLDKAFTDYVAMRKKIKKPMTDRAVDIAIKKLNELSGGDNDMAVRILEQSIMNSWQGLFPLKEDQTQKSQGIDWSKV